MNRGTSKVGSFSFQCTNKLFGMQKATKNNVNTNHRQLRNMLPNFLAVIGLSWGLDHKKNGTEPKLKNQMEHGIVRQKKWWQISLDPVIRYFVPPAVLREENFTQQRREKEVNPLEWWPWNHRVASPHSDFCESAQYLRSNSRFMRRSTQTCQGSGETYST